MTDRVGQQIGNYLLFELLGKGGFAEVYLGKHYYLQSYAALKVLRKTLNEADEQQFLAEAQTLVRLRHPNIVRVLDFAVEQGTPVLIMEYAPHGTLRERYPSGTRLSLATVVAFVLQVASALQYAHNHHVIHRDVKPGNILLDTSERLLLSDFGLSLLSPSPDLLSTQEPAGTFPYTAPEQLRGKPCFASDQYALAVIAYEWLCGRRPFEGNAWEVMHQHLYVDAPPLRNWYSELPAAVEAVILRALAKDPQERFVSVQAFAQALARASQQQLANDEDVSQITAPIAVVPRSSLVTPRRSPSGTLGPAQHHTPVASVKYSKPSKSVSGSSNRQRLLAKVRVYWITGVLKHSLHGTALITLGLREQAQAVANPWRLVLQQPDFAPQRLPVGTGILQVYDDAGGELLILGEPGSGKTTLLLELARDLLDRAEKDETHPIPVVFNLSSWAAGQQPLASWLVEELNSKYQVPRKLAQGWVENNQILPLLDGFDEVALAARAACLRAINVYRQEHGLLPMVVCSRSTEYLTQKALMQLGSAVMVQPLTDQQVDDYLESGGEALSALQIALQQDAELRKLTSTPLMLSVLTLAYQGMPLEQLLQTVSPADRQRQVFEHYVERMLQHRGTDSRYTPAQTTHWLAWLSRQLVQRSQSVFYIERMQPNWLAGTCMQRWYPCLSAGLIFGLLGLLGLGPIGGLLLTNFLHQMSGVPSSLGLTLGLILVCGMVIGSLFGLLNGLLYAREARRKKWKRRGRRFIQAVLNGCLTSILLGLPYGWLLGHRIGSQLSVIVMSGGVTSLLGGIGFGLIDGLLGIQVTTIQPAEAFVWSWAKMGRKLVKYVCFGLLGSLLIGLLLGPIAALYEWAVGSTVNLLTVLPHTLSNGLQFGLAITPFFALIGGLLGGLTGGLSSEMLDARNLNTPNQGIRRSARHGVQVGVTAGLLGFLIGGVCGGYVSGVRDPYSLWIIVLTYGLIVGPITGLVSGLRSGGIACIEHVALRLLLRVTGSIPWNYSRFLDYAAERILLRKVGGGYIFTHRLLLDYFATLDVVAPAPLSTEEVAYAPPLLCDCGYLENRIDSRFCPSCGKARM